MGKSRVLYIVLAFFLGGLGIHNFYAGYTKKALIQLLVMLFLGWLIVPAFIILIWIIIDIFTVTEDADGTPFS